VGRGTDKDFPALRARYNDGLKLTYQDSSSRESIRGSKAAELLSRCAVESVTSTYYKALADCVIDDCLKTICSRLAQDEIRHFSLFRRKLEQLRTTASVSIWRLIILSVRRFFELQDDQMAYAFYVASDTTEPYCRRYYAERVTSIGFDLYTRRRIYDLVTLTLRVFSSTKSTTVGSARYRRLIPILANCFYGYIKVRSLIAKFRIMTLKFIGVEKRNSQ
jgi:hypothetical protein